MVPALCHLTLIATWEVSSGYLGIEDELHTAFSYCLCDLGLVNEQRHPEHPYKCKFVRKIGPGMLHQ